MTEQRYKAVLIVLPDERTMTAMVRWPDMSANIRKRANSGRDATNFSWVGSAGAQVGRPPMKGQL